MASKTERALVLILAILVTGFLGVWGWLQQRGINAPVDETAIRVLFVGNSYTMGNDLPQMFAALAESGGQNVQIGTHTRPGWRLDEHMDSPELALLLTNQPWDYVVLQEQSFIPAVPDYRDYNMLPAVENLVPRIAASGAQTVLFMTWGYRDGDAEFDSLPNYYAMQTQVTAAYYKVGNQVGATVAPVGVAWEQLVRNNPTGIQLWEADGSHPSRAGSYLAATVFYATLFRESPVGLAYTAGLEFTTADYIQRIAASVVLP